MYILHCWRICCVGEIGLVLRAGVEFHAAVFEPLADGGGFGVADLRRFVVEGRLAEPLLEDAGRVQQVVGDDRVEHAHAAFVEDAHDRLVALQRRGELLAELDVVGGSNLHSS